MGELVIPRALQSPEVLNALQRAAAAHNIPLDMLKIGNAMNRINPNTGQPEFTFDETDKAGGMAIDIPSLADAQAELQGRVNSDSNRCDKIMGRRAGLIADLQNTNVQAGLDEISQTEGSTGYNARYGKNPPFDDFSRFPAPYTKETPSGRYQIDWKTYQEVAPQFGITDFSPQSQDLIGGRPCLKAVGKMTKASLSRPERHTIGRNAIIQSWSSTATTCDVGQGIETCSSARPLRTSFATGTCISYYL